jgi:hypothetical protein
MTTLDAPLALAGHARAPLEDHWFAALDGCVIDVDAEAFQVCVLGIHRDGEDLWIQLAPFHESDRGLLIHCWPENNPDEVLAVLRVSLNAGRSRPHIIEASRILH